MPQAALFACMRNEGPFLLEWLAYHRAIGFAEVIVATNACTDGSDHLLDILATHGLATHLPNAVPPGTAPQDSGMQLALTHLTDGPDWLCHLDSDEFLNIRTGDGHIGNLVSAAGSADSMALAWRAFGHNGHSIGPGETLPAFTTCEAAPDPSRTKFKSLFRHRHFAHAHEHMPTGARIASPQAVNALGKPLAADNLTGERRSRYRPFADAAVWDAAQVNHYTRSQDAFMMKNDRGDGQGNDHEKYRIGGRWHQLANRNDAQDRSILRHWPATQALLAVWRASPAIAAAEAASIAAYVTRRDAVLTPAQIRRWTQRPVNPAPTLGVPRPTA